MNKIINSIDGKHLYELDEFHSMLSDEYLYDKENKQTKFLLEQFYRYEQDKGIERMKLLNLSYSLPSLITEKFADYVGEPETSLDFELDSFVSSFIWGGLAIFRPQLIDGEFKVSYVPANEYILSDDGSEKIFTYYEVVDNQNFKKVYIYEEKFEKNLVTRKLYEVSKLQNSREYSVEGKEVPLNTIPATSNVAPFETLPNITRSPLVKVHNRILVGSKYGTSEIKKIRSLISSIEIEAFNIQDQFLKHLQAKIAVPATALKVDKNGKANVRDLEAFAMEAGDTMPAYVVNGNPLIDKSFDQIEDFLRQICAILTIPTEFMGLKDGGSAESADTKRIRLVSFIKKVEKIRKKFEKGFTELLEIKNAWVSGEEKEVMVSWPSIFPDNPIDLVT